MKEIKKIDSFSASLISAGFCALFILFVELCRYSWIIGKKLGLGVPFSILSFLEFLSEMLMLLALFFLLGLLKGLVISYIYNKIAEKIGGLRIEIVEKL